MDGNVYAAMFSAIMLLWPVLAFKTDPIATVIALVVNGGLFAFVAYYISGPKVNYWRGFSAIASTFMSGCANITLVYIFPVLSLYFIYCVFYTVVGVLKGDKSYAEMKWFLLVRSRTGNSFD